MLRHSDVQVQSQMVLRELYTMLTVPRLFGPDTQPQTSSEDGQNAIERDCAVVVGEKMAVLDVRKRVDRAVIGRGGDG